MLIYIGITTYSNTFFTQPCNSLANIFYIFTGRCNNYITILRCPQFFCQLFRTTCNGFSCKSSIVSVYLPIMNASNTIWCKIFLLKSISSN